MEEQVIDQIVAIPTEKPLPEKLFRSYIKGNALIPQIGAGMNTFLLKDILDGECTIIDFYNSFFSDQQVETVGKTMNNLHSQMKDNVPFRHDKNAKVENGEGGPLGTYNNYDLSELWVRLKQNTIIATMKILEMGNSFEAGQSDVEKIGTFIKDPGNAEKLKSTKVTLEAVSRAFEDKRFKEAAVKYREATAHSYHVNSGGSPDFSKVNSSALVEDYKKNSQGLKSILLDILNGSSAEQPVDLSVVDGLFHEFA